MACLVCHKSLCSGNTHNGTENVSCSFVLLDQCDIHTAQVVLQRTGNAEVVGSVPTGGKRSFCRL